MSLVMVKRKRKRRFVMRPVLSSVLSHYGWFSVGLLVVRLNHGDIWCYRVPDDGRGSREKAWRGIKRAKSKGRWWNRNVKGVLQGVKLEGDVKLEIESYIVKEES